MAEVGGSFVGHFLNKNLIFLMADIALSYKKFHISKSFHLALICALSLKYIPNIFFSLWARISHVFF